MISSDVLNGSDPFHTSYTEAPDPDHTEQTVSELSSRTTGSSEHKAKLLSLSSLSHTPDSKLSGNFKRTAALGERREMTLRARARKRTPLQSYRI
ncbi:unnamed protein product [Leuciscus chuanchicus]